MPREEYADPDEVRISKYTKQLLKEMGYHAAHISKGHFRNLRYRGKKERRETRPTQAIPLNLDYNVVQYFGIARYYIQKKYDLRIKELELLLFLYPIGFFTKRDYHTFPHNYTTRTISHLMKKGLIEPVNEREKPQSDKQVYKLSRRSKNAVLYFYKYASGEEPIPENPMVNDFFKSGTTRYEQKLALAMAKLNKRVSGRKSKTKEHKKLENRITETIAKTDPEKRAIQKNKVEKILEEKRIREKMEQMEREKGD